MPNGGPLTDGGRYYNQWRRIHPQDPVSQLDYYLASSSLSSASANEPTNMATGAANKPAGLRERGTRRQDRPQGNSLITREQQQRNRNRNQRARTRSPRLVSSWTQRVLAARETILSGKSGKCAHREPSPGDTDVRPSAGGSIASESPISWLMGRHLRGRTHKKTPQPAPRDQLNSWSFDDELAGSFSFAGSPSGNTVEQSTYRECFAGGQVNLADVDSANLRRSVDQATRGQQRSSPFVAYLTEKEANQLESSYEAGLSLSRLSAGRRATGTSDLETSGRPLVQARAARLKRRNRRMMLQDDGQLVDPYALSELFSQSEIPGFREIFASDSYLRKFCWILAFLFMTVLSLNDMTELISEYYDYPITVNVRLTDSARLTFPAVTVCNLNVVRFSALCSPNAKYDLTNQIPSELREKLCGIQVEKKKDHAGGSAGAPTDSDISDINNIGLSTTTTTTTSSSLIMTSGNSASSEVSSSASSASSTTMSPGGSITTNSAGMPEISMRPLEPADEPLELDGALGLANGSSSGSSSSSSSSSSVSSTSSPAGGVSRRRPPGSRPASMVSTTNSPATTARRKGSAANGALDLGDFVAGSSAAKFRQHQSQWPGRSRRSFEIDWPVEHPFGSKSARRVAHETTRWPAASQFNKPQGISIQANRLGAQGPTAGQSGPGRGASSGSNSQAGHPPVSGPPIQPANGVNFAPNWLPFTTPGPTTTTTGVPLEEVGELTERQERELQENLTNWLAVMHDRDPVLTWSLGHQFDDMVLRCTMKSYNCTHQRSFESSFSPTEGNCFTYRSRVKRRNGATTTRGYEEANLAGTSDGLELVLNLEKGEYISGSAQVGALVMVHHPSDLGYAASEATFVAPEFTTYIGLKMVNITRLPAPYPEYCVDSWPAKFADKLVRNSTYSQQACLRICLQKTIQAHCQCQYAFLPIVDLDGGTDSPSDPTNETPESNNAASNKSAVAVSGSITTSSGTDSSVPQTGAQSQASSKQRIIVCDTRKSATRQCVKEVMLRAADRVHNCECPPKCQVIRYDKTISMARWPTKEDKVSFDRGKLDVSFQNLAKVIVYFQTMTCEDVSQQAVFNAAKLFSALGGIMGMYVGFSFLSVFEIFEVVSRKLWHHSNSRLARHSLRLPGSAGGRR